MDPFLGEIRLMSFDYAPKGWMYCQGQVLNITQNPPLFSLLGTTYGGNGQTTFALPDLRGRAIVGAGSNPALSSYMPGQQGGVEAVTMSAGQMPPHTHTFTGTVKTSSAPARYPGPNLQYPATGTAPQYSNGSPEVPLNEGTLTGDLAMAGGQPHENRQPLLVLNYAIAIVGIFPSRG